VVNIITRKGGPLRFDGLMEAGGQGTTKFLAATNGSSGAWSWGAGIERLASDGDTSFRESIGTNVTNDDYERVVGTVGLGWSDRATRSFTSTAGSAATNAEIPGPMDRIRPATSSGSTPSRAASTSRAASRRRESSATPSGFVTPDSSAGPTRRAPSSAQFGESEDKTRRTMLRYQADRERGRAGLLRRPRIHQGNGRQHVRDLDGCSSRSRWTEP
jgi:hypothetical protein